MLNSRVVESCNPQFVASQGKQKHYYDQQSATLHNINRGVIIRVQKDSKHWEPAVIEQTLSDRYYIVRTSDNKLYRRNRRQLHVLKIGETTVC